MSKLTRRKVLAPLGGFDEENRKEWQTPTSSHSVRVNAKGDDTQRYVRLRKNSPLVELLRKYHLQMHIEFESDNPMEDWLRLEFHLLAACAFGLSRPQLARGPHR